MFRKSQHWAIALSLGILLLTSSNCFAQERIRQESKLSRQEVLNIYEVYLAITHWDGLSEGEKKLLMRLKSVYEIGDQESEDLGKKLSKLKSINEWTPRLPESRESQMTVFYWMTMLEKEDGKKTDKERVIFGKVSAASTLSPLDRSAAVGSAEVAQAKTHGSK